MSRDNQLITQLLLTLIILILLAILAFVAIGYSAPKNQNNGDYNVQQPTPIIINYPERNYPVYYPIRNELEYRESSIRTLSYDSSSYEKTVEASFGNKVDKYFVKVRNSDIVGAYFMVDFVFYNPYGEKMTRRVTKYIHSGETETFTYQDVRQDRERHYRWTYKVTTEKESPRDFANCRNYRDSFGNLKNKCYY